MKKNTHLLLVLILVFTLILTGCGSASPAPAAVDSPTENYVVDAAKAYFADMPADVYKIAQNEFIDKVKANEDIFIMDIRQAKDYEQGHIKGAVNVPWGEAIAQNLGNIPKDKPVYVYCYTGQTAGQTVALLNVAGINAKSVNLGWNLGISTVAGVADIIETTNNPVPETKSEINQEVQSAINEYFTKMAELKGTTYANYKISEDDAKKLLDSGDTNVMFLSVRKAEDFDKGHIPGAINLAFVKGMQAYFDLLLPKDKKIIVYCYTGQTAGQTVAILRLLGYDAVSLNSGMGTSATPGAGWINKGYPIDNQGAPSQPVQPSPGDHS